MNRFYSSRVMRLLTKQTPKPAKKVDKRPWTKMHERCKNLSKGYSRNDKGLLQRQRTWPNCKTSNAWRTWNGVYAKNANDWPGKRPTARKLKRTRGSRKLS